MIEIDGAAVAGDEFYCEYCHRLVVRFEAVAMRPGYGWSHVDCRAARTRKADPDKNEEARAMARRIPRYDNLSGTTYCRVCGGQRPNGMFAAAHKSFCKHHQVAVNKWRYDNDPAYRAFEKARRGGWQ